MNELLLALRSSYRTITRSDSSVSGSTRRSVTNSSRSASSSTVTTSSDIYFDPPETSPVDHVFTEPPSPFGDEGRGPEEPDDEVDVAYLDPITPLKRAVEGPESIEEPQGQPRRIELSENEVDGVEEPGVPIVDYTDSEDLGSSLSSLESTNELFTPRTRKRWSQCTNNLFVSYNRDPSEGEGGDDIKETSIDGIFIEFDNDIPSVVDRKRCAHISALARVTCVHHKTPKFVKRRESKLKSKSCDKIRDDRSAVRKKARTRPYSAENSKRTHSETAKAQKVDENLDLNLGSLDPLAVYLTTERSTKPSRESLSASNKSSPRDPEGDEQGSDSVCSSDEEGSNKENDTPYNASTDESVPREVRFPQGGETVGSHLVTSPGSQDVSCETITAFLISSNHPFHS